MKGSQENGWISVKKRLPTEEELERSPFHTFLVAESGEVKEATFNSFLNYFSKSGMRLYGVTHWSNLPDPPSDEEES